MDYPGNWFIHNELISTPVDFCIDGVLVGMVCGLGGAALYLAWKRTKNIFHNSSN